MSVAPGPAVSLKGPVFIYVYIYVQDNDIQDRPSVWLIYFTALLQYRDASHQRNTYIIYNHTKKSPRRTRDVRSVLVVLVIQ